MCSLCSTVQPEGVAMHGCRDLDVDICEKCFQALEEEKKNDHGGKDKELPTDDAGTNCRAGERKTQPPRKEKQKKDDDDAPKILPLKSADGRLLSTEETQALLS